jgi:hypothetical protein
MNFSTDDSYNDGTRISVIGSPGAVPKQRISSLRQEVSMNARRICTRGMVLATAAVVLAPALSLGANLLDKAAESKAKGYPLYVMVSTGAG